MEFWTISGEMATRVSDFLRPRARRAYSQAPSAGSMLLASAIATLICGV